MPNWCSNGIEVIGDNKEIQRLKSKLSTSGQRGRTLTRNRALIMIIQEYLSPGSLSEMSSAILCNRIVDGSLGDEQLFNTINHIWQDFDLNKLSTECDEAWSDLKWDFGGAKLCFEEFVQNATVDIPFTEKLDYIGFDFSDFFPHSLATSLLSFNNRAEKYIERIFKNKSIPENEIRANVNDWGTKWNAIEVTSNPLSKRFNISFITAWSPPIPIMYRVSEYFPELTFDLTFSEPSMDFCGRYVYRGGELLYNQQATLEWIEDEEGDPIEVVQPDWIEIELDELLRGAK